MYKDIIPNSKQNKNGIQQSEESNVTKEKELNLLLVLINIHAYFEFEPQNL